MNLLTKFQPDPTVDEASEVAESCWTKLPLFTLLSLSVQEKTQKVINIGLSLHIGSEPNPTTTWVVLNLL